MQNIPKLLWKRPQSCEFPKVWHTFTAKDIDSENLVDYRIEDLTESRYEEALSLMAQCFAKDEPLCESYGALNDPEWENDHIIYMWRPILQQKMVLVCYKSDSDEIVGLNMNFVLAKDDHYFEDLVKQSKSQKCFEIFRILSLLYKNFDIFNHYGVDKYLTSAGLLVTPQYRGRGIVEKFLKTRDSICKEFEIKLTSTSFTSDISSHSAAKAGFKLDISLSYDEIRKNHPELGLGEIKSKTMSLRSKSY